MLIQSSRLPARMNDENELVLLAYQNRSLWDQQRINAGLNYLEQSAEGPELTTYHLEAHIAATHAVSSIYEDTDWQRIYHLYEKLYSLTQNPVVKLNKIVALSMISGVEAGLQELKEIEGESVLDGYYLLPATFADFYDRLNDRPKALEYYQKAFLMVGNTPEKRFLERRMLDCSVERSA